MVYIGPNFFDYIVIIKGNKRILVDFFIIGLVCRSIFFEYKKVLFKNYNLWYDSNGFLGREVLKMNLSRNDSRMLAMTILYQVDLFNRKKIDCKLDEVVENNLVDIDGDVEFAKSLVYGVMDKDNELVDLANKYLNNWNINRLGIADAAILKIAIYELLYTDTPNKVCIDEAIELAKDFSDEKVVGMINGVLDRVYHEKISEEGK